jgi:hypothetical protein
MTDDSTPVPEIPPAPGSAQAARGGRIGPHVITVLGASMALAVVAMVVVWFLW